MFGGAFSTAEVRSAHKYRTSATYGSLLDDDVLDEEVLEIKVFRVRVRLGVLEETEDELNGLLGPAAFRHTLNTLP